MINHNHRIVPTNIYVKENRFQDRLEAILFGDCGWKAVQGLGAAMLRSERSSWLKGLAYR